MTAAPDVPADPGGLPPGPFPHAPRGVTRANLRAITGDGAAFSVMVGMGERCVQAFALALGLGDVLAGLAATLPWLMGAAIQLVSPWAVIRWGSQKRWVVWTSVVQALSWAPFAVGAALGALPAWALFAAATLYWASGFAAGPAWTAWVETLVPPRVREHYFARRSAICQAALLLAIVAAGVVLHVAEKMPGRLLAAFAVVFGCAVVARTVSVLWLTVQTEPVPLPADVRAVPLHRILARIRTEPALRTVFAVVPLQGAVYVAEPFFAPYVVSHLRASYGTFLTLIGAAFVGRIAVLPAAGVVARRWGARRLLWLGSIGMTPVAALWLVSDSFAWLAAVQFASGLAWGCYELGAFLVLFDAVPHGERGSAIAAFTFVNALGVAAGSLLGAALLGLTDGGAGAYLGLFAFSTVARVVATRIVRR